jgi:peptidoglycan/LPS O-acetylase OafA/YrhL
MTHRVPALDVLRLIAVLGVVAFHYGFRGPTATPALPALQWLGHYGFLGVPVFFIISGFVIAYSAEDRTAREFAIARFTRIYPTFLLCMTLTFLALLFFGAPAFQTSLGHWIANLAVAAPGNYMDSAYWSLVIEIIFYGWVVIFIWLGWFQRSDFIVALWLALSLLNEITVDWSWVCKLLLADYSGFFTTGILIYQFHKGRRDARLLALLAASIAVAVYQATHNLGWLRIQYNEEFDDAVVATLIVASVATIMVATRIRRLPAISLALGGLTYPLYLLHQMLGYVAFQHLGARPLTVTLVTFGIVALSWAIWRYFETPLQPWMRRKLTQLQFKRLASA